MSHHLALLYGSILTSEPRQDIATLLDGISYVKTKQNSAGYSQYQLTVNTRILSSSASTSGKCDDHNAKITIWVPAAVVTEARFSALHRQSNICKKISVVCTLVHKQVACPLSNSHPGTSQQTSIHNCTPSTSLESCSYTHVISSDFIRRICVSSCPFTIDSVHIYIALALSSAAVNALCPSSATCRSSG